MPGADRKRKDCSWVFPVKRRMLLRSVANQRSSLSLAGTTCEGSEGFNPPGKRSAATCAVHNVWSAHPARNPADSLDGILDITARSHSFYQNASRPGASRWSLVAVAC